MEERKGKKNDFAWYEVIGPNDYKQYSWCVRPLHQTGNCGQTECWGINQGVHRPTPHRPRLASHLLESLRPSPPFRPDQLLPLTSATGPNYLSTIRKDITFEAGAEGKRA